MKKENCVSSYNFSAFRSPEAPIFWEINAMDQRGCSSERIPQPNYNAWRRNPFYGKTLPSKWEDAERWISSPVMSNGFSRNLLSQPQRRPKSKSGPIDSNSPNYSPAIPKLGSALSTGVLVADGVSLCYGSGLERGQSYPECNFQPFAVAPRWSDILSESPLPSPRDDKDGGFEEAMDSGGVLRRNVETQMSTEDFTPSSNEEKDCFSSVIVKESDHSSNSKQEVRDVQVDKRATVIERSNGHKLKMQIEEEFSYLGNLNESAMEAGASSLDIAEAAIQVSKVQREEAKITAWENLQKAKAEAELRELEMKLERTRSSSMDKILKKLRKAQTKAHRMRNSFAVENNQRIPETNNIFPFHKHVWMSSLKRWFACDASS